MRKYLLIGLAFLLVLFIVSILILSINDEILLSEDFPLQQRWVANLNSGVESISTNRDQIIFVRTSVKLYALDVKSGEFLWSRNLDWQAIPQPVIEWNGIVFYADGKAVWALDQTNGEVVWQQPVLIREADVKSVSGNVVAVDVDQDISIYNAINGALLWSKTACRNNIQAYVENSYVYIPCYGIKAIDILSGEDEWEIEKASRIANVTYQDGIMYYSPEQDTVSAFDLRNRRELWKTSFSGEGFRQFKTLDNYLYVTSSNQFCIFQRETGDRLWCAEFDNPQNPTVIGNTLYIFNGNQNMITAFDFSTGHKIGDFIIRKKQYLSFQKELMVSADNILVFGSGHKVYGFGE